MVACDDSQFDPVRQRSRAMVRISDSEGIGRASIGGADRLAEVQRREDVEGQSTEVANVAKREGE